MSSRKCHKLSVSGHFQKLRFRKAQGPAGLVLALSIITIAIILVFFISLIQKTGAENRINDIENKVGDEITLLSYLRTPVGSGQTISDLIVSYKYTEDSATKALLKTKTEAVLNPLFQSMKYSWRIKLDGKNLIEQKKCGELRYAEQEIMLYDGSRSKVQLVICD
jgi:hypothetical protein